MVSRRTDVQIIELSFEKTEDGISSNFLCSDGKIR